MAYIYLAIAGILFGGVVFFAKVLETMGASAFEIMLLSNLLPGLLVAYPAWKYRSLMSKIPRKVKLLLLIALLAVNLGEYVPLFLDVSVTMVVLLLYLQPVWTILIERFYFKRIISRREWILVGVMIAGLVILINPFHDVKLSPSGVLIAIAGGIGLSLWVIITKYFSLKGLPPTLTFGIVNLYAVIGVLILYGVLVPYIHTPAVMMMNMDFSPRLWLAFLFYAAVILTLPNLLIFSHNREVPAERVGMILLLEPFTGIILDVIFFHTPLTWDILLGGLMILGSNLIIILGNRKSSQKAAS